MKELVQRLENFFQQEVFETFLNSSKINFRVQDFFIRGERHTEDKILYIKPSIDSVLFASLEDRKKIEKAVFKKVKEFGIEQVIVPYSQFWGIIKEQKNDYDKELSAFVLKLLYRKKFKIKKFKYQIAFEVHPYMIEDGVLPFDVRSFIVLDENKHKRRINYLYFDNIIEETVLDRVRHLGIKEAKLVGKKEESHVLAEQKDPVSFVQDKKFTNYLTPVGLMSFILTEPAIEDGILKFRIKNFVAHKGEDMFFEADERFKPFILKIVNDDVSRYGIPEAQFMGQAATTIA